MRLRPALPARLPARLTVLVLAAAGLAALPAAPTATAAPVSTTVSFTNCVLEDFSDGTPTTLARNQSWSPTISLDVPGVMPARTAQPAQIGLTDLPAGTFPSDLFSATVTASMLLGSDDQEFPQNLSTSATVDSFNAGQALPLPLIDGMVSEPNSGFTTYRAVAVVVAVVGTDGAWSDRDFRFTCDRLQRPPALRDVAVYDLDADPVLSPGLFSARQGQPVSFGLRNMLTAAPTDPPARVVLRLDGTVLARVPLDGTGGGVPTLAIPEFLPPGRDLKVTATNGSRVARARITIEARKAKLAAPAAVRSGARLRLTGAEFKPGERVALTLAGGTGAGTRRYTLVATADRRGQLDAVVTLARAASGSWTVTALGRSSGRPGSDTFRVR
ncbi:hypothetical protein [Nocardioides sp.]|uniref:hypothetical protein n=1 Tax=Nocardioides sp. TaxID=35761 RepID=UPI003515E02D